MTNRERCLIEQIRYFDVSGKGLFNLVCAKIILYEYFLDEKTKDENYGSDSETRGTVIYTVMANLYHWMPPPLPTICGTKLYQNKGGTAGPNSSKLILRGHEIQSRKGLRQVQ